jgi:sugar phosphate isomerase/epimerase
MLATSRARLTTSMAESGLGETESIVRALDIPTRHLSRPVAIDILNATEVPPNIGITSSSWPIGAAMLQFPAVTPRGLSVRDAGEEYWSQQLLRIKREGFDWVEIPSAWLPIGEMRLAERRALVDVLNAVGLGVCATSVVRKSVIDPRNWEANLSETHRAIDAAADVRSRILCLGLHEPLTADQKAIPWFWTTRGPTNPDDRALWGLAVRHYQELADHAGEVGIDISLELYEGTYLGSCDSATAFIADIGRDNVGLNPDLGNLIRAQVPIEPWEAMAVKALPLANYWHVKNYTRAENPGAGIYLTTPTSLAAGLIDYRMAVAFGIASGFRGPFLCENYGGDGLSVSAENATYLRRILTDVLA